MPYHSQMAKQGVCHTILTHSLLAVLGHFDYLCQIIDNNAIMKNLGLLFVAIVSLCTATVQAQGGVTVQVGHGSERNEVIPVYNYWKDSYTGNEVIYLREELGLQKGDRIVALAYNCIGGSANGGNFNVRIVNTTLNTLPKDIQGQYDVSAVQVGYDEKVYCNTTLGTYSQGDWITFDFNEPFVYEGDNIILDIRNTAPASSQAFCYFAASKDTLGIRRDVAWRNANSENVVASGFNGNYDSGFFINESGVYEGALYPNTRITYIPAGEPMPDDGNYVFYQHSYIIDSGISSQLPIELINRKDIAAIEFDLDVSEGILLLSQSTKGIERGADASLTVSNAGDNLIHLKTQFDGTLSAGKGQFCQLGVYATKSGVYTIKLLNPTITKTDGFKHTIEDSELQFVAKGKPGDINGDNAIDGNDLNELINIILGK